jgi:predicted nucleic acid-binding protein
MDLAQLDSDIVSEVLKQRQLNVRKHAHQYLRSHGQFAFSAVSRFEVIRGYKKIAATALLARFMKFCAQSLILPVTDEVFDRAADLWVLARRGGHPCNDSDLLIAATALEHGRRLITGNTSHFAWIAGLLLTDWRQP